MYERKMLEVAGNVIRKFGDIVGKDVAEQLAKEPDGRVFTFTVSGPTDDESVYLMPFPVEIGTHHKEKICIGYKCNPKRSMQLLTIPPHKHLESNSAEVQCIITSMFRVLSTNNS